MTFREKGASFQRDFVSFCFRRGNGALRVARGKGQARTDAEEMRSLGTRSDALRCDGPGAPLLSPLCRQRPRAAATSHPHLPLPLRRSSADHRSFRKHGGIPVTLLNTTVFRTFSLNQDTVTDSDDGHKCVALKIQISYFKNSEAA